MCHLISCDLKHLEWKNRDMCCMILNPTHQPHVMLFVYRAVSGATAIFDEICRVRTIIMTRAISRQPWVGCTSRSFRGSVKET